MFLPFRTNIQPRRTPYATYGLVVINIIVFMLQFTVNPEAGGLVYRRWVNHFVLVPGVSPWWTLVTYAFLHHDLWHIGFNMFFLYLFGRNVNDKLGGVGYVVFYLLGAAASGGWHALLHATVNPAPTLGASGAVAAVTGAYLVLFPQTLLTIVYWFFFIGTIEVPAMYFIALKMIFIDNVLARGGRSIAYDAHLGGYAYGIVLTLLLLATRIVSTSHFDLWAMIKRWNRRRHYRDAVAGGYDPFTPRSQSKPVTAPEVKQKKTPAEVQKDARVAELRGQISQWLTQGNLAAAADLYIELVAIDPEQILPRQHLLDVANQLAGNQRPAQAARAYEQFLTHYGNYEYAEQVELMLGILYARYLSQPEEAVKHLRSAVDRLSDPGQLEMCRAELARLEA
jgi:membrane associated rhomboid family serine protease